LPTPPSGRIAQAGWSIEFDAERRPETARASYAAHEASKAIERISRLPDGDRSTWRGRFPCAIYVAMTAADGLDLFIGGGLDRLAPGGGVMRTYAARYARETGRPVHYSPNARVRALLRDLQSRHRRGLPVNLIGHSWGAVDAFNLAAHATAAGFAVRTLITLDPVRGPGGRVNGNSGAEAWLHVEAQPAAPNRSDWVTAIPGLADRRHGLPVGFADRVVRLGVNHENVVVMMRDSGARGWLDVSWAAIAWEGRFSASRSLGRSPT
jgi:pimeloyl-ACP methyl ester carboxylesterase